MLALGGIGVFGVIAFTVPFWATGEKSRAVAWWGGVAALVMIAVFTVLAYAGGEGH